MASVISSAQSHKFCLDALSEASERLAVDSLRPGGGRGVADSELCSHAALPNRPNKTDALGVVTHQNINDIF